MFSGSASVYDAFTQKLEKLVSHFRDALLQNAFLFSASLLPFSCWSRPLELFILNLSKFTSWTGNKTFQILPNQDGNSSHVMMWISVFPSFFPTIAYSHPFLCSAFLPHLPPSFFFLSGCLKTSRKVSRFTFQRMLCCKMDSCFLSPSSLCSCFPLSIRTGLLFISLQQHVKPGLAGRENFRHSCYSVLSYSLHWEWAENKRCRASSVLFTTSFFFCFIILAGFWENDATVSRVCWWKSASRTSAASRRPCYSLSVSSVCLSTEKQESHATADTH